MIDPVERRELRLEIATYDIGLTQYVRVSLGGVKVIDMHTATKRVDWSLDAAQAMIAKALGELFRSDIHEDKYLTEVDIDDKAAFDEENLQAWADAWAADGLPPAKNRDLDGKDS